MWQGLAGRGGGRWPGGCMGARARCSRRQERPRARAGAGLSRGVLGPLRRSDDAGCRLEAGPTWVGCGGCLLEGNWRRGTRVRGRGWRCRANSIRSFRGRVDGRRMADGLVEGGGGDRDCGRGSDGAREEGGRAGSARHAGAAAGAAGRVRHGNARGGSTKNRDRRDVRRDVGRSAAGRQVGSRAACIQYACILYLRLPAAAPTTGSSPPGLLSWPEPWNVSAGRLDAPRLSLPASPFLAFSSLLLPPLPLRCYEI